MHSSASETPPTPPQLTTPILRPMPYGIHIAFNGVVITDSSRALRLLWPDRPMEPELLVPLDDVVSAVLVRTREVRECPVTGRARYYDIFVADMCAKHGALIFTAPTPEFEHIKGYVCFPADPVPATPVNATPANDAPRS